MKPRSRCPPLRKRLRQPPQRDATRRVKDFGTTMCSDRENRASLRKTVRAWETSPQGGGSMAPKLTLRVPPLGEVHLTEARDQKAKLQESVQNERGSGHREPP